MPSPLRIGVNALYLIPGGVGGTEIYLRNLLAALAEIDERNEYFVYLNRESDKDVCPSAANFHAVDTGVQAASRPRRLAYEQTGLALRSFRDRLDVLFSPGFTSPIWSRGRRVTVIHDLQHKKQPKNFGLLERLAWNVTVRASAQRSSLLITVSKQSRKDLLEAYGLAADRVRVVGHGVETALFGIRQSSKDRRALLDAAGVPREPFLLAVSTVHPHKNWDRLLDAYQSLAADGRPDHLVVCGLPGKAWRGVRKRLRRPPLQGRVHLLGWQPRAVVTALFQYAEALVFPSTFEGFGMPVAEALAAGLPTACSDIPPLHEIASGAAQFFDPLSTEDIHRALSELLENPELRRKNAAAGKRKARKFTWRRAAEKTLAGLLEAGRG